jgi:hypothetical protein
MISQRHRQMMLAEAEGRLNAHLESLPTLGPYRRKRRRTGFSEMQLEGCACAWCGQTANKRPMLSLNCLYYCDLVVCMDPPCLDPKPTRTLSKLVVRPQETL